MDPLTCPQCSSAMTTRHRGGVDLAQCTSCEGIFLSRSHLGMLIEEENDWHVQSGPRTQPVPRILPGMTPPPEYVTAKQARSYLDQLFG